MQLEIKHSLPFVSLSVAYRGMWIPFSSVLLDTGSAATLLSIDLLSQIGVEPEPQDEIRHIRGVGGIEVVFCKKLDKIRFGETVLDGFVVEVGAVDYGFEIEGIIGTDFLIKTGAIIDLSSRQLSFPTADRE